MKKTKLVKLIILFFILSALFSCEKEELGEQTNAKSTSLSSESHNTGQNCMNCHKSGSSGEGWFSAAGSVYNSTQTVPYITATVQLRTAQSGGGTLVSEIEVDMNGNFYTTETIDYGTGLYASLIGGTSTQYMSAKITNGTCNSCHDASKRIWAE